MRTFLKTISYYAILLSAAAGNAFGQSPASESVLAGGAAEQRPISGSAAADTTAQVIILFRFDKSEIDRSFMKNAESLDALHDIMSGQAIASELDSIIIIGGSSPDGSPSYNRLLAQRRANSIMDYIMEYYPYVNRSVYRVTSFNRYWDGLIESVERDANVPARGELLKTIKNPGLSDYAKAVKMEAMQDGKTLAYLRSSYILRRLRQGSVVITFRLSAQEQEQELLSEPEPQSNTYQGIKPEQEPASEVKSGKEFHSEPEQRPEPIAEPESLPESGSEQRPVQLPELQSEPELVTQAQPEQGPERKSASGLEQKSEPEPTPQVQPEPVQEQKLRSEPTLDSEPESLSEPEPQSNTDLGIKPEQAPASEVKSETESHSEPEQKPEPIAELESLSESEQVSASEPQSDPKPHSEPEQRPEPIAELESLSESEQVSASEPQSDPKPHSEPEQKPEPIAEPEPQPGRESEQQTEPMQDFSPQDQATVLQVQTTSFQYRPSLALRTNLLLDLAGCPNIGIEVPFGNHFSAAGDFAYAYIRILNQYTLQTIQGTLEARYWFKQRENILTGWNVGVYGTYCGRFDIQFGSGYQGDGYWSFGLSGGYSLPIAKRLNLDFSVAGGYLYLPEIREYSKPQDGHLIWEKTIYNASRVFLTQVRVNLVWIINTKVK